MSPTDEEKIAAPLAKAMAMICVRNTMLETLHAGPVPVPVNRPSIGTPDRRAKRGLTQF